MDYVMLWFVLLGVGGGYIPPVEARTPQCGLLGPVVGVIVDRLVNPTAVLYPDPQTPGAHCQVDVSTRVRALAPGEYQVATTEMMKPVAFGTSPAPRIIGIDPHVSLTWTRAGDYSVPQTPPPPAPLVTCTVQSVGTYADGDAKLTVRCNTNGKTIIPKGSVLTVQPK